MQWKERPNSWTWSVISAQNNDAVQPGTPHGSACLLVAALIGKLSNTKQKALNQQTTVAEFWSRTMSFVCLEASVVSWAHCWVSMSTWGIIHFFSIPGEPSPWEFPLQSFPMRMGCPYKRESSGEHGIRKKDTENSLLAVFQPFTADQLFVLMLPTALDTNWGDHAWIWLAEPIFLLSSLGLVVWYLALFLHVSLRVVGLCDYY